MIFATVGTQLPFPRLIDALDALAADLSEPVIAQCGPQPGSWRHLEPRPHLTPGEYETLFAQARLVVAHAGIGTILSAKRLGKPLVILPRRHALGEHRNDHQLATAREVAAQTGCISPGRPRIWPGCWPATIWCRPPRCPALRRGR